MSQLKSLIHYDFIELGTHQVVESGLNNPFLPFKDFGWCQMCGYVDPHNVVYLHGKDILCGKHAPKNSIIAIVEMQIQLGLQKFFAAKKHFEMSPN